jgi:hypothetical protein
MIKKKKDRNILYLPQRITVQLTANITEEGIVDAATPGCDYAELVWLLKNWLLLCWVTTRLQHRDIFGPSSDQGRQGRCSWTYRRMIQVFAVSDYIQNTILHFVPPHKVPVTLYSIHRVYQSVCPIVGTGSPSPLPRNRVRLSPWIERGEQHSPAGDGVGRPNSDDWIGSLVLCGLNPEDCCDFSSDSQTH